MRYSLRACKHDERVRTDARCDILYAARDEGGETVRTRVRDLRTALGVSQIELARRAGLSRRTIQSLEYGSGPDPRLGTLKKVADALGVPVEALFEPVKESAQGPLTAA